MQKFNAPPATIEVRLTRLDEPSMEGGAAGQRPRAFLRRYASFLIFVIGPVLLSAIYFFGMAADRYETQAQYVVRTANAPSAGALQNIVQGGGVIRSADDAYITHAYIQSRDAMKELLKRVDLLSMLGRPGLDFLWRYPSPFGYHSDERLYKRLQSHVSVVFDRTTGITTLKVQAFTPEDSRAIAQTLLENAEQLVNRLSERGRQDAVASAELEVTSSRNSAIAAQARITQFRSRNSVVDPGKVSTSSQETIARLALESAQIGAQLRATQRASPNSPQIETEKVRIAALEEQIMKERQRLAGEDASLAPLIAEYESLMLERQLMEQTFGSNLTALEAARTDSLRQRLFLDQIAAPYTPDYAAYPYRLANIAAIFAIAWTVFALLRRFYNDAKAHAEN